jgi:hypothetical protein
LGTVPHIDAQGIYTYDTLGPNLVENGGFGELAGWTIYGYAWSPQTGGESGGYISFQNYAYQDVPTQPGSTYLLQFWTQNATPLAHVYWGSEDLGYFPSVSGLPGWEINQVYVAASASSTQLYFTADSPFSFVDLDEVGVFLVSVPEPPTFGLAGLVGMLLIFHRREK